MQMKFNKRTIPAGNLSPQRNAFKLAFGKTNKKKNAEENHKKRANIEASFIGSSITTFRMRKDGWKLSLVVFNCRFGFC